MKRLLILFCLSPFCSAQSKPHTSLTVGSVSLWLGMPKAEALQALEDAGITKQSDAGGLYIIVGSGEMGTMSFTNGRLSFADREWISQDKTYVDAMLGALEALSSHGAVNCRIQHAPITEPNQRANRIFIDCGDRGVMLMQGSFQATGNITSVTERIGHLTAK